MKLYFSPGACSFAPHVILNELGLPFQLVRVDTKNKKAEGEDFLKINPKGYVPVLQLDSGKILTEGVVIMQYLADQKPESGLAPKLGSMERYELMEMMNYITTELHKGFSPLFGPDRMVQHPEGIEQYKTAVKAGLTKRLAFVADILAKQKYLLGDKMTIADVYLLTVLRWSAYVGFDISGMPSLGSFISRMQERPSVQAAIKAEGLKA